MKAFHADRSPIDDYYIVAMSEEVYPRFLGTKSSYNVLFSRILGLSYADGWRYIRDNYNGKISGKQGLYCSVTFENMRDCVAFCDLLNARWYALFG